MQMITKQKLKSLREVAMCASDEYIEHGGLLESHVYAFNPTTALELLDTIDEAIRVIEVSCYCENAYYTIGECDSCEFLSKIKDHEDGYMNNATMKSSSGIEESGGV